jgi:hypothetical protein
MVRSGSTVCNSAVESRTSGTVRRRPCWGEASSSSCNSVKLSRPARGEADAGRLRPAVDAAPKASVARRRCFRSHWMKCCCCHSNRVDGTCDRSPCGSKTPVFNSVRPGYRRGVLGLSRFWLCYWKNGGCLRSETTEILAPACVTPHSYHGMFSLYSVLLSTGREFGYLQFQNNV